MNVVNNVSYFRTCKTIPGTNAIIILRLKCYGNIQKFECLRTTVAIKESCLILHALL
jgi:hypothetical protein